MQFFTSKTIDPELQSQIIEVQGRIKTIKNQFEYQTDPKLINSYIYELKALEERYSYYLAQCRDDVQKYCNSPVL